MSTDFRRRRQDPARPHQRADDGVQGRPDRGRRRHGEGHRDPAQEAARTSPSSTASRETAEGRIAVFIDPAKKVGAIVEVRCESAPVAKSEQFVQLANDLAKQVALKDADDRRGTAGPAVRRRPEQDGQRPHQRRDRPDPREHEAGPLRPPDRPARQLRPSRRHASACWCRSRATKADAAAAARRVHAHHRQEPGGRAARGRAGRT